MPVTISESQEAATLKAQGVIQARAALLDHCEMEGRRIGNGLHLHGGIQILALHRDGRPIRDVDTCPKVSPKSGLPNCG